MEHHRKKIKFKKTIDFNFVSTAIDSDNHVSHISSSWFAEKVMQSVIQIRNVESNPHLKEIYNKLIKMLSLENKRTDLDIFMSWVMGTRSNTHVDEYDVLITGCYGRTLYKVGDKEAIVEPGDVLFIPKDTVHTAIGLDPRIILSTAIYND